MGWDGMGWDGIEREGTWEKNKPGNGRERERGRMDGEVGLAAADIEIVKQAGAEPHVHHLYAPEARLGARLPGRERGRTGLGL